jgi:hypothetical protein
VLTDQSQASFVNSMLVRTTPSSEPGITAGASTRLTMQGNVLAGFDAQIIRGVSEARRKEILSGNIVVPAPAPARAAGRNR